MILPLFTFSFLDNECPRDKPILKSSKCQSIYCTPEEFNQNICVISNYYIKTQWLNNFHHFAEEYMSHISVSESPKGDLFLSSHKISDDFDKYLYGFNSEGEGLFYNNETNSYTSFEIIDFPRTEYADYNIYTELYGKGYLISVPTDDDIYLIDYVNKTIQYLSIFPVSKNSDTIFKINGYDNMFFTAYIYCSDTFNKNCFSHFQSFKIESSKIERINNITKVPTILGTRINCFQDKKGYILSFHTKKEETDEASSLNHYLSLIDPISFKFVDNVTIENNFLETRFFEETVELRENLYILAYSNNEDVIKLQFKNISVIFFGINWIWEIFF